ncbi:alpha/beta fold hydrolase [Chitinophaga barathri]|uniref:Alpha/beta hydrolase n=1 Tax=Chitinophaga barathri TaxID=1647451 RepID=A0A3N4MDJ9_9BACT|nr:alpha/beta hydrolase [Chitinophaga barathri]RPD42022.1 alpha/beta hydrolase [Chitinophaga barathri]
MKKRTLFRNSALISRCLAVLLLLVLQTGLAMGQSHLKDIVLVHGAFADGSGWEAVYQILSKKGYKVHVVGNPNTGLPDDVAAVNRVLDKITEPVVLVGHSYGGAIITEAGNHPRVAGLVYISAFAPDANEPLLKLLEAAPPTPKSGFLPPDKDGYIWYDKAKYHAGFCGDLPKDKAAFLADSQVPVSATVFGAVIANPAWKSKKSWYVVATQDETIHPDGQRFMAKRIGATVTEIKASHLVFMSQPKATTEVIETAAAALAK